MQETSKHLAIHQWAEDDKPREKFLSKGKAALSNAELIALLLGNGTRNKSAVELSKEVLQLAGNDLVALGRLREPELMKVKGIGKAKAVVIAAALELGRRRKAEEAMKRQRFVTPKEIYEFFTPEFENLTHEEFWIILLNRNLQFLKKECISIGGLSSTVVDVQKIMKQIIECDASTVVLAHNHPSGNLSPSNQDLDITRKIKDACKLFNITVADHLIFTDSGYYSFADSGIL